jgi:pilus assembly protein CpaE
MQETIRVLVATNGGPDRDTIAGLLSIEPDVEIVGFLEGSETADAALRDADDDVLVVTCGGYSDDALAFIRESIRQQPQRPVVVLCEGSPNGFTRRVFEAGADDIVPIPDSLPSGGPGTLSDQVLFALQKAMARRKGTNAAGSSPGPMICVLGPKGGTGKTLTASNLAVALAEEGARVAIVDLDLQFGDVGLALGLTPEKTIYDLARSSGSLDGEKLEDYMATHDSGVRALLAPTRPDHAGAIGTEFLASVYTMLRSTNEYVVVDTPPGFTPEMIASIDSSTHVCMVGMLDSLALKNTKLGMETLSLMGYESERVRLVLNRADSRVGITEEDVVDVIGRPADVLVPSHRDITRSVNEGSPILLSSPRSEAARAFRALAATFSQGGNGSSTPTPSNGRRFQLGRRK